MGQLLVVQRGLGGPRYSEAWLEPSIGSVSFERETSMERASSIQRAPSVQTQPATLPRHIPRPTYSQDAALRQASQACAGQQ